MLEDSTSSYQSKFDDFSSSCRMMKPRRYHHFRCNSQPFLHHQHEYCCRFRSHQFTDHLHIKYFISLWGNVFHKQEEQNSIICKTAFMFKSFLVWLHDYVWKLWLQQKNSRWVVLRKLNMNIYSERQKVYSQKDSGSSNQNCMVNYMIQMSTPYIQLNQMSRLTATQCSS